MEFSCPYFPVFGPEKLQIRTLFRQCHLLSYWCSFDSKKGKLVRNHSKYNNWFGYIYFKTPYELTAWKVSESWVFLVHIFMYSYQEKLRIWTLFTQCYIFKLLTVSKWSIKANTYSCSKKGLYHWLSLEFSQCLGEVISFGKYLADSFCQSKHLENINSEKDRSIKNKLSSKTLKNGQTYFKSLEVFMVQDFLSMFGHSSTICLKGLSCFWIKPTVCAYKS